MPRIKIIDKKGSTLHDYPYDTPARKCPHFWIINVTPPGPSHCIHHCLYCYARQAIYSDFTNQTLVYGNLPELVARDLKQIKLCPPISISNISDPCQPIPELSAEESDSPGLPHCERFLLPFARKQPDGRFRSVEGCAANCHVSCRGLTSPPCGHPELALPRPFKRSSLR